MNHKKFGKLLTEISKMTKKHFSPSQVIALTEKFSDPVVVKHDVIEVKDKLCKEPIDLYDGTVFQCLMGFAGSISITGLKKKLSLTGDEVRLQASLYKGMNRKIIGRNKVHETNMYFTVIENLPIMKSIITRINGGSK